MIKGIICFGDSILSGTGASSREKGCSKRIKDSTKLPVSLQSRNRDTSRDALLRVNKDVIESHPYSHVLILFGNNDCWLRESNESQVSIDEFRRNVETIVKKVKQSGKFPILINLQPLDNDKFLTSFPEYAEKQKILKVDPWSWQKRYSDGITEIAINLGLDLVDIRTPLEKEIGNCIGFDGLHPNDRGHEIIANTILEYLRKVERSAGAKKHESLGEIRVEGTHGMQ